jgi:Arc/MetJ-type ribon-helix-helix transcriptional regulator
MTDDVTIKIPRPLYLRLKALISETGFHSVTEFVVYVLRDLAASAPEAGARGEADRPLDAGETDAIRRRLAALGYLPPEEADGRATAGLT